MWKHGSPVGGHIHPLLTSVSLAHSMTSEPAETAAAEFAFLSTDRFFLLISEAVQFVKTNGHIYIFYIFIYFFPCYIDII